MVLPKKGKADVNCHYLSLKCLVGLNPEPGVVNGKKGASLEEKKTQHNISGPIYHFLFF